MNAPARKLATLLFAAIALATGAHANPLTGDGAERLVSEGNKAYEEGRYDDAAAYVASLEGFVYREAS